MSHLYWAGCDQFSIPVDLPLWKQHDCRRSQQETPEFIPVEIEERFSEPRTDRAGAWVETGGRRIFFAADADPEWVARVLGALPSC